MDIFIFQWDRHAHTLKSKLITTSIVKIQNINCVPTCTPDTSELVSKVRYVPFDSCFCFVLSAKSDTCHFLSPLTSSQKLCTNLNARKHHMNLTRSFFATSCWPHSSGVQFFFHHYLNVNQNLKEANLIFTFIHT